MGDVSFEIRGDFIPTRRPQILASCIANIGAFALGCGIGWSAPALPAIEKSGELGVLTSGQRTWIASIVTIGALTAGPVAGFLLDRIGRRMTLLAASVPFILAWIMIACSSDPILMTIGRYFTGLCGGAFSLVVPVYVSEIADKEIRGALGSVHVFMIESGILFSFVAGTFCSWVWLSILCAGIPMLFICLMIYMPETPQYLLAKGKLRKAGRSLRWLRRTEDDYEIKSEIALLQRNIDESLQTGNEAVPVPAFKFFFTCDVLKPLAISLSLHLFQQCSLINVIVFYTVDLFKTTGISFDPYIATIIIGIGQVAAVGISMALVDRVGRRVLLCTSTLGSAFCLGVLGLYFFLKEGNDGKVPESLEWLPIATLVVYILVYGIGLGPLPWLLMGELLPPQSKGLTSGISTSLNWFLAFVITKWFVDIVAWLGEAGAFWAFASICFLSTIFSYFLVPETKGKTLAQIRRELSTHNFDTMMPPQNF